MILIQTNSEDVSNIMKTLNMCESFYIAVDDEESYDALMLIFETSGIKWSSGTKASSLHRNYSWFKDESNAVCIFAEYSKRDRKYILWADIINDKSYDNHTLIHFTKGG